MKKKDNYQLILKTFGELQQEYPHLGIGKHIATVIAECGDVWGTTDKEFLSYLEKYRTQLSFNTVPDQTTEDIIEQGKHLDTLFINEEDDGY